MKSSMVLFKMKIFKVFFISGLMLLVASVSMKRLMFSDVDDSTLKIYKTLVKLLNHCYHDNLNPLIMSNIVNEQLEKYSSLEHSTSLILMDDNFLFNETQSQWTNYYPNSATFVVIVDSIDQLTEVMKKIFYTVWSNKESNFILVDLNSCQHAYENLERLWRGKYLATLLLCYNDLDDVIQLYTYNPFTDRAPYPWIKVGNKQTWTLYQRNYQEDKDMCLNLIYDKTKYLDGYQIGAAGVPKPGVTWIEDEDYDVSSLTAKLPYFNAQFALNIFLKTNITAVIHYSTSIRLGRKHQLLLTSFNPSQFGKSIFHSYPLRQTYSVIITQKRPFLSAEDKILSFYSFTVILLVSISLGILFIALIFNKKQSWLSAVMELMRLLVSTGILQPLNKIPLRIYLFGIFWLLIILNATFQGHLAKFLTRPERESIDSLADLKKFGYKIYVHGGTFPSVNLSLSEIQQPFEIFDNVNGYEVVLNNSRAAYIIVDFRAYEPAYQHQLHVSNPCGSTYQFYIMNLPLQKRIDEISFRYAESGLQDYWDKHAIDQYKMNLTNTEELETSPRVRALTITDILFMLKFLAIGHGIAFIVFLIEVFVGWKDKKLINRSRRINVVPI